MISLVKRGCDKATKKGLNGSVCGGSLPVNKIILGPNSRYGGGSIPSGPWRGGLVSMTRRTPLGRKLPMKKTSFSAVMMDQKVPQGALKHLNIHQRVHSANFRQGLERLREAMIKERRPLQSLGLTTKTNISNLCGHASFVVLSLAYLETDVLALRGYAASGIGLSILFQFYRAQPLWIPIGWNALFLGINVTMIGLLVKERNQAEKYQEDPEQARTFQELFEPVELTPVDFVRLMDLAERREVPKGQLLSAENKLQEEVFLIVDGTAKVESEGVAVCHLEPKQFVGTMCFNRFMHASPATSTPASPGASHTSSSSSTSPRHTIVAAAIAEAAEAAAAATDEPDHRDALMYIDDSYVQGGRGLRVGSAPEENGVGAGHKKTLELFPKDSIVGNVTLDLFPSESIVGEVAKTLVDDASQGSGVGGGESAGALERSLTTVSTTTDTVLYAWDMHLLRAFIKRRPLAGASIQKAISADLNRKVEQSRGHEERYRLLLVETLDGGVITHIERKKLCRYRDLHSILYEEHKELLREHGWTEAEFEAGFQKNVAPRDGSKDFLKYEALVRRELAKGEVKDKERQHLREFRASAGIDAQEHLLVLENQGWTADDYEIGAKGKAAELEKRSSKANAVTIANREVTGATSNGSESDSGDFPEGGKENEKSGRGAMEDHDHDHFQHLQDHDGHAISKTDATDESSKGRCADHRSSKATNDQGPRKGAKEVRRSSLSTRSSIPGVPSKATATAAATVSN